MNLKLALSVFALVTLYSCAHHYEYTPEVKGPGAMHAKNAVIYTVPPENPTVKMQLVSLGIGAPKPKNPNDPKVQMLQIRIFFQRVKKNACDRIFFQPNEQMVAFQDGVKLRPAVIHGSVQTHERSATHASDMKHAIKLSCNKNQAVELFYALPKKKDEAPKVQSFTFSWNIHYGAILTEHQTTRFDRDDPNTQSVDQATFVNDEFYPYDATLPLAPDWIGDEWYWMDGLAVQPDF